MLLQKLAVTALLLTTTVAASAAPQAPSEKLVFSVVVSRHGVRSFTHAPPEYTWPDWAPVAPGFLTEHGYRLMTFMGAFYRAYFREQGLPMGCSSDTFVYADRDQRTLETARALIEGACGSRNALPMHHIADIAPGVNDPLFDGSDWLTGTGKIDTKASTAAVLATLPSPPSAVVAQHAAEFATLQRILDTRCSGTCTPVTNGQSVVAATKKGIAELGGPVDLASDYAESLFLQTAQCGPAIAPSDLEEAMKLHVLAYDVNARNAYNPWVKGGNLFAHMVSLMETKAGKPALGLTGPDISRTSVVLFSGHDTQLGALGGVLGAHWAPRNGIAADDMPPGASLIFGLYRKANGAYVVRTTFVSQSVQQMRSDRALPDGVAVTPVTIEGCTGGECSLAHFVKLARHAIDSGFVQKGWPQSDDAAVRLAPLVDPAWTNCER